MLDWFPESSDLSATVANADDAGATKVHFVSVAHDQENDSHRKRLTTVQDLELKLCSSSTRWRAP